MFEDILFALLFFTKPSVLRLRVTCGFPLAKGCGSYWVVSEFCGVSLVRKSIIFLVSWSCLNSSGTCSSDRLVKQVCALESKADLDFKP